MWWLSQYAYTWDATKSVDDNNAALAASEFGYRRSWYSRKIMGLNHWIAKLSATVCLGQINHSFCQESTEIKR